MEQPLVDLIETHASLTTRNALESYHDAQQALDMAINLFSTGYLPLDAAIAGREALLGDLHEAAEAGEDDGRGAGGSAAPRRVAVGHLLLQLLAVPVGARQLGDQAALSRHADPPARTSGRRGMRCSATSRAIPTARSISSSIAATCGARCRCTRSTASPYYLGVFLVGAYQEILGDLHNLYGDTHAVHVSLDADNRVVLDAVIKGDTVREVLKYVQFDGEALITKLRSDVEAAVRERPARLRGVRPAPAVLRRRAARVYVPRRAEEPKSRESRGVRVRVEVQSESRIQSRPMIQSRLATDP